MRKLLLIRHAKSSWKFPDLDDHERPLNKRGERDSLAMARHLHDKDEILDVMYSSTATRALMLAESICDLSNTTMIPDLSFYTFDADELLQILRCLPDDATRVGIVAHNPGITRVANKLSGERIKNVPTSGVVALQYDGETWAELGDMQEQCRLEYFDFPKMLT